MPLAVPGVMSLALAERLDRGIERDPRHDARCLRCPLRFR